MRYWYYSDNLSWTSIDGYEIWLDSDIKGYKLFSPDGFCLGVWFCDDGKMCNYFHYQFVRVCVYARALSSLTL